MHVAIAKTTNSCLLKFEAVDLEANLSSKSFPLGSDPMHIYVGYMQICVYICTWWCKSQEMFLSFPKCDQDSRICAL
jgi:hypothetical protein